jgi:hypothetical protein
MGQVQAKLARARVFLLSFGAPSSLAHTIVIKGVCYFCIIYLMKKLLRLLAVAHLVPVFLICKN